MAYSGRYIVKNKAKYSGDHTNVTYRSLWEKLTFMWLERNTEVKSWSSEETVIPYFWDIDKKYHRYFVDIKVTYTNGKTHLIEIKPAKETAPPKNPNKGKRYINEAMTYVKNMNKWEAANNYAKDRGWVFEIWTEDTLKKKGIMKVEKGKLKPLRPLAPYRKKKK